MHPQLFRLKAFYLVQTKDYYDLRVTNSVFPIYINLLTYLHFRLCSPSSQGFYLKTHQRLALDGWIEHDYVLPDIILSIA